jgi:hypothetical protein
VHQQHTAARLQEAMKFSSSNISLQDMTLHNSSSSSILQDTATSVSMDGISTRQRSS